MVFNVTFNNISVISWQFYIGGGNESTQRKPPTCLKSLTNFITSSCTEYTTMKPVLTDHPFGHEKLVFHDRWSLKRGVYNEWLIYNLI